MTRKFLIGSLLGVLAFGVIAAKAQGVFNLYTSLTGNEIINDMANPTGAQFTTKVLATKGLAGVATTVAALPTCNAAAKGSLYVVTDASSPTYGASLTGSSTTIALALCSGSAWVAH